MCSVINIQYCIELKPRSTEKSTQPLLMKVSLETSPQDLCDIVMSQQSIDQAPPRVSVFLKYVIFYRITPKSDTLIASSLVIRSLICYDLYSSGLKL